MKLVDFLTKVVSDEAFREGFCRDPEGAIQRADLGREAQRAIRRGDPRHVAYVVCVAEGPATMKFDPID